MSKTYVFQDQITGSFLDEINDNVNIVRGRTTLVDDLNILRTQIRKVLNGAGTWTDTPPLDLHEIHARFTGSLTLNLLTGSSALFHNDLNVHGNTLVAGGLSVFDEMNVLSDVYAQSNLNVAGSSEFVGKVLMLDQFSALSNVDVLGNLYISGNSIFNDEVAVINDVSVTGNVHAFSDIHVYENLYATGSIEALSSIFASGSIIANLGLSGSLTRLADGTPAFVAGAGITITSSSNGPIIISSSVTSNTSKGYLSGNSSYIDKFTGVINFGPTGANIGILAVADNEVIDVYLNGVYLAYGYDIFDITHTTVKLSQELASTLVNEDIISIILRSVQ